MSDTTPSPREPHVSGSHYQPSLSVVLVIVVLFVGATFLMVRAASPTTATTTTTTTTAGSPPTTKPSSSTAVNKSKVRVQVANGTNTPGLAANFTKTLKLQNWDVLPAGNGPHVTATIIYYNPPFLKAAQEVAATIGVSSSVVHPLGGLTLTPLTGTNSDDVIVVLGPNSAIG